MNCLKEDMAGKEVGSELTNDRGEWKKSTHFILEIKLGKGFEDDE